MQMPLYHQSDGLLNNSLGIYPIAFFLTKLVQYPDLSVGHGKNLVLSSHLSINSMQWLLPISPHSVLPNSIIACLNYLDRRWIHSRSFGEGRANYWEYVM